MHSHGSLPWGIKENDLSINESFLPPQIQTNNNRKQQLILSPISNKQQATRNGENL
jgi:hypothetical protein